MVIEELNVIPKYKESFALHVLVGATTDAVNTLNKSQEEIAKHVLGIKPETPIVLFKLEELPMQRYYWQHKYCITKGRYPFEEQYMYGATCHTSSLSPLRGVCFKSLINLVDLFPMTTYRERSSAIHNISRFMNHLDEITEHKIKISKSAQIDLGEIMFICIFRKFSLPTLVEVEPYMAKLESSVQAMDFSEKLRGIFSEHDKELFEKVWVPLAESFAKMDKIELTEDQRIILRHTKRRESDKKFFNLYEYQNAIKYANAISTSCYDSPWKLTSGVDFMSWIIKCGYATRDKDGGLRPRKRVASRRLKKGELGPDPCLAENKDIAKKVLDELIKEKELEREREALASHTSSDGSR